MASHPTEDAWNELKHAAQRRHAEVLDIFGPWPRGGDGNWSARLTHDWVVEFRGVGPALATLVQALQGEHRLSERVGNWEVQRELVRQAALDELSDDRQNRSWREVMALMAEQMTTAVVAVPVAGMYSAVTDSAGNARPVQLGEFAVAGHLDEALEASVDELAKRHGLVGFRFSNESWWTEDLMTGKEDPQIGQEILEEYADRQSWPWFVIATNVSTSGIAAEVEGVLNAEALIGALVLLDHPPGDYWSEGLPWIPGELSRMSDPFDPAPGDSPPTTQPQVVDGRARRLQTADNEAVVGVSPPELDAGSHMTGPGRSLLAELVDPAAAADALAVACRLALHAASASSPEAKHSLAASAVALLLEDMIERGAPPAYDAVTNKGVGWRAAQESEWPPHRWGCDQQFDAEAWRAALPSYEQVAGARDAGPSGVSMSESGTDGHVLLHAVQALFFGRAAEQPAA